MGIKLKDRVRCQDIRKKTDQRDVLYTIGNIKCTWAGHLARTVDDRWTKLTTEWPPSDGTRSKGRPKTRWEDEIRREVGIQWQTKALNRNEWKTLGETFAQKWAQS